MSETTRFEFEGYSDGACKGNPGPGGWGAAMMRNTGATTVRWVKYGGKRMTTNNEMELTGALEVLKLCPVGHDIVLYMDTQYFLKGVIDGGLDGYVSKTTSGANFTGWVKGWRANGWRTKAKKPVANLELWKAIIKEIENHLSGGSVLRFKWVKGHSGNEGNELADRLAGHGIPQ
jgi:ribonuclease HI